MGTSHLASLLGGVILLFIVCFVSASPAQPISEDKINQHPCPVKMLVSEFVDLARISVLDSQEFLLNPNMPVMSMKFLEEDVVYKARVDGTMVELLQCDVKELDCITLEEGGTKDSNLLRTNGWNVIRVSYNYGQLSLVINGKKKEMGGHVKAKGYMNLGGQVMFLVPTGKHNYTAKLRILCHDEPPIIQLEPNPTTSMAATTTISSSPRSPYEKCPVYQIEVHHPSIPIMLHDNLTLAIYPSHPSLQLNITDTNRSFPNYYVMKINEFYVEMKECEERRKRCSLVNSVSIGDSALVPETWNYVTLSLNGDKLVVDINEKKKLLWTKVQPQYRKVFTVVAVAPTDLESKYGDHFVALVNVQCEVIEQEQMWPTDPTVPTPTQGGYPTKGPIVEVTTETPSTGISRDVIIVVGVLVGLLVLIGLAILISAIKKHRSATITELSPLQNQFQQQ